MQFRKSKVYYEANTCLIVMYIKYRDYMDRQSCVFVMLKAKFLQFTAHVKLC